MRLFGWEIARRAAADPEAKGAQFEDVLQRIVAAQGGSIGSIVSPETCMQSPTVHAIVTAVSRRMAVSPVHIYKRTTIRGREAKERLPSHPVAKLLAYPNSWQTRTSYWLDAASALLRYGNYYAYKSQGSTGPIRELIPLQTRAVSAHQSDTFAVTYRVEQVGGRREYSPKKIHHVRGAARDFLTGDSPVKDVQTAIALEILAEKFGASFFNNGALPLMVFKYMQGVGALKTKDDEAQFIRDFQAGFSGSKTHRALLLPKGIETGDPVKIENDKAQMLETRKYQRTVIAGAFGVPPHLVGDLERATFNNVEQQDSDFTLNVVMPIAQAFEAAMERDLLTDDDYNAGVIIRFNLDSILRADFKSRQEGLQTQRQNGVLSADEWREIEGKNPLEDDSGGNDYWRPGNMLVAGEPIPVPAGAGMGTAVDVGGSKVDLTTHHHQHNYFPKPDPQKIETHVHNAGANIDIAMKSSDVHMTGGNVNIPPANITYKAGDVSVEPATVNVSNDIPAPIVHVENKVDVPSVHVSAPEVTVHPPAVNVTNKMDAPEVHVAAPTVNVAAPEVTVHPPEVTVHNSVESPEVYVSSPTVNVAPADVKVTNVLPDFEVTESEAVRDSVGRLLKTITTKKRKR